MHCVGIIAILIQIAIITNAITFSKLFYTNKTQPTVDILRQYPV